jgi:hypothetical protein
MNGTFERWVLDADVQPGSVTFSDLTSRLTDLLARLIGTKGVVDIPPLEGQGFTIKVSPRSEDQLPPAFAFGRHMRLPPCGDGWRRRSPNRD